jgi:hypothetical protein
MVKMGITLLEASQATLSRCSEDVRMVVNVKFV